MNMKEDDAPRLVPLFGDELTYIVPGFDALRLQLRQHLMIANPLLFADNVWPGCRALADYLVSFPEHCKGKSVVELGAGLALPSLVAIVLGAQTTVLTDYPEDTLIRNIEDTLRLNELQGSVVGHAWGDDASDVLALNGGVRFDLVLLSEVLWKDTYRLHAGLASSLLALLHPRGMALLSVVHRPTADHTPARDLEFLARCVAGGLTVDLVLCAATRDILSELPVDVALYKIYYATE